MKTMHLYRNLGVVAVGMMSMLATSCEEDIDNTVSRNQSSFDTCSETINLQWFPFFPNASIPFA